MNTSYYSDLTVARDKSDITFCQATTCSDLVQQLRLKVFLRGTGTYRILNYTIEKISSCIKHEKIFQVLILTKRHTFQRRIEQLWGSVTSRGTRLVRRNNEIFAKSRAILSNPVTSIDDNFSSSRSLYASVAN